MKRITTRLFLFAAFFAASTLYACKSKTTESTTLPSTTATMDTTAPAVPAPVQISSDDVLKMALTDALKDHPAVKGDVSDSVIILSGEIKRADWQKLNPVLNSLHPKRINSDSLTIIK